MISECRTEDDYRQILETSRNKPVLLLKHSTACPTSKRVRMNFETLSEEDDRAEYWQVLVRENKPLSTRIAEDTGVEHQSPQVILFHGGRAVWDCSHHAIENKLLAAQIDDLRV